jgi:hypothetical protein
MILIIRGHIRNTFKDSLFLKLIRKLCYFIPDLDIYIHTWNIFANNKSWRDIEINENIVTKDLIYEYFAEIKSHIRHIIIDDDTNIELIGNLEGNVGNSLMPLIGWKNYWYSQYKIIQYIYENNADFNEIIINTRFDVLNNSYSVTESEILYFITKNKNLTKPIYKNIFIHDRIIGVDNIYIGNIHTMFPLIQHFFMNLDSILTKYTNFFNQEKLILYVNHELFVKNNILTNTENQSNLPPLPPPPPLRILNKNRRKPAQMKVTFTENLGFYY